MMNEVTSTQPRLWPTGTLRVSEWKKNRVEDLLLDTLAISSHARDSAATRFSTIRNMPDNDTLSSGFQPGPQAIVLLLDPAWKPITEALVGLLVAVHLALPRILVDEEKVPHHILW